MKIEPGWWWYREEGGAYSVRRVQNVLGNPRVQGELGGGWMPLDTLRGKLVMRIPEPKELRRMMRES